MELGNNGVAALASGRLLVSVANSVASAAAEELQPSLATETLVALFVSPWLGALSDAAGRKVLLVGGPTLAAASLGWAALQKDGSLRRHHSKLPYQIALAISFQAWQIGYGATVSDLDLDPSTEQGIEVVSTLTEVLAECALASCTASSPSASLVSSRCSNGWLAIAATLSGAAGWCIGTFCEEPLDEYDQTPFDSANILAKMSRWRRQHPAVSKAMLLAFLLESGRQQHEDVLETARFRHSKGWSGADERKLALVTAVAGLAAAATIKPTLERYNDRGTTQLASWAHLFECVAHTPLLRKWRFVRILAAVLTPSISANGEYTQGTGQEDSALEAACGHGEMNVSTAPRGALHGGRATEGRATEGRSMDGGSLHGGFADVFKTDIRTLNIDVFYGNQRLLSAALKLCLDNSCPW